MEKFETTVDKKELLEKLRDRRNKITECYIEALDAFWEQEGTYLEAQLTRVKAKEEGYIKTRGHRFRAPRRNSIRSTHPTVERPTSPQNIAPELDHVIAMVEAHSPDTFVLNAYQFSVLWKGDGDEISAFQEVYTELTGKEYPE